MEQSFQVYIIQSQKHGRFYTGMSSNPGKRLHDHNSGFNSSTRNGIPWVHVWLSQPMTKTEAKILESKIKKRGAQRFIEDIEAQ